MQKRPLFLIITIAAKATDRSLGVPQVSSRKGLHLQGGADRTGDPILTNAVFHVTHTILSLKLGNHKGLALFIHGKLLKWTWLAALPAVLVPIPIRAFLSPVPACCGVQSRTAWCCPAAAGGTQLQETQCRLCIFSIISLIINIISIIGVISKTSYIQFVSLSPSFTFSIPLVGG